MISYSLSQEEFFSKIRYFNAFITDEVFPEKSTVINVDTSVDFSFQNIKYQEANGLLIAPKNYDKNVFNIEIKCNSGIAILFIHKTSLKINADEFKNILIREFTEMDTEDIKYFITPTRLYADGIELAIKYLKDKGIIAIFSRALKPFRKNKTETIEIITTTLKDLVENGRI